MDIALLVRLAAAAAWFLAVTLVVWRATKSDDDRVVKGKGFSLMFISMIVLAVLLTVVGSGIVFIQPSFRGVVTTALDPKGYRPEPLQPGLHWIFPFAESVSLYNISRRTYTMSSLTSEGAKAGNDSVPARTKDRQLANVDASVIYQLDPNQVVNINILWQSRFEDSVVRPITRSAILDAVSQYNSEELISSKRSELEKIITQNIAKEFANQSLLLSDFVLRDINFSPEYTAAIEQKQVAEQQALQAQLVVEQRKQEAEQARQVATGLGDARLIQAEAEAKALGLVADILKQNPDLLSYQYINKLAPNIQVMLVPNNAPFILPLPQLQGTQTAPTPMPTSTPIPTPTPTPTPTATP
jgi:regulator of protease activity HflC (stomatin/prohibitin superfamily)